MHSVSKLEKNENTSYMRSQMLPFISIVLCFIVYTIFKGTELWPFHSNLISIFTLILFAIMLGGTLIYRSNTNVFNKTWFQIISWVGAFLMGLWASFILISLPIDLLRLLIATLHWMTGNAILDFENQFFSESLNITVLILAIIIAFIGLFEVLRGPKIKQVKLSFKNIPPSLQGLKIAQISDLHIGPTIRKHYVEQVVNRTNAIEPDLIFITGDLVDAKTESITKYLSLLSNLKSRFGVFYVTGNHEYYWDVENLLIEIKKIGIKPLMNENNILDIEGTKLLIAGITDPMGRHFEGHHPNIQKALTTHEATAFKILLAHRPNVYIEAEPLGFNLQLSGHTHAGQFFPFSLLIGLAHKYYRGLNQHANLSIYVNPGTGYWGPTNRFAVASEITSLTLQNLE